MPVSTSDKGDWAAKRRAGVPSSCRREQSANDGLRSVVAALTVRAARLHAPTGSGEESMTLDHRFREAEARLFARGGLHPEESFLDLASAGCGRGCSVSEPGRCWCCCTG
jgi:hypothetical protein